MPLQKFLSSKRKIRDNQAILNPITVLVSSLVNWKHWARLALWFGLIGLGAFVFLNIDLAHRKRELYLIIAISVGLFISGWVGIFRYSRFWTLLD